MSDEDRIAARQLKKREEREIKAAHKSRTSSVTQPVAAAKQQKYSKETSKKAKAQVRHEIWSVCPTLLRTARPQKPRTIVFNASYKSCALKFTALRESIKSLEIADKLGTAENENKETAEGKLISAAKFCRHDITRFWHLNQTSM